MDTYELAAATVIGAAVVLAPIDPQPIRDLNTPHPAPTTQPVVFHRVIVRAPADVTILGGPMVTPPDDAFDPAAVRIVPVSEVRAGDTIVGTIQPHYGPLLEVLDRAQWVCWTSHKTKPQSADARPFDPGHCWLCTHNFRNAGRDRSCWTVDGCTTYRPDSLLLVIPRELAA